MQNNWPFYEKEEALYSGHAFDEDTKLKSEDKHVWPYNIHIAGIYNYAIKFMIGIID